MRARQARNQGPSSADGQGSSPSKQKIERILSTIYSDPATTIPGTRSREICGESTGWKPACIMGSRGRCRPARPGPPLSRLLATPTTVSRTPKSSDLYREGPPRMLLPEVPMQIRVQRKHAHPSSFCCCCCWGFSALTFSSFLGLLYAQAMCPRLPPVSATLWPGALKSGRATWHPWHVLTRWPSG